MGLEFDLFLVFVDLSLTFTQVRALFSFCFGVELIEFLQVAVFECLDVRVCNLELWELWLMLTLGEYVDLHLFDLIIWLLRKSRVTENIPLF